MNKKKLSSLILTGTLSTSIFLPALKTFALSNQNEVISNSTKNEDITDVNELYKQITSLGLRIESPSGAVIGSKENALNIIYGSGFNMKQYSAPKGTFVYARCRHDLHRWAIAIMGDNHLLLKNTTYTINNATFHINDVGEISKIDTKKSEIANIPDANLKAALNKKIAHDTQTSRSDSQDIYVSELKDLKGDLVLHNLGIKDISGLENCINLNRVHLSYNEISDISPLTNLTHLTFLHLYNNKISDISPLKNLTNLTHLTLTDQKISGKDIVAKDGIAKADNMVIGLDGTPISPSESDQYTYDSKENKIIFNNIADACQKSYNFNLPVSIGKVTNVEFSGSVTQNITINKAKLNTFTKYNLNDAFVYDLYLTNMDYFDMATKAHTNTFEVKNKDGEVVYTGSPVEFKDPLVQEAKPHSSLQIIVPNEYRNSEYSVDLVVKDENNVEQARFTIDTSSIAQDKTAYYISNGLVLNGTLVSYNNYDNSVKKSIVVKDSNGNIKLEKNMANTKEKSITNTDWYGGNYSGFQAILTTDDLNAIGDIDNASLFIKVEYKGNTEELPFIANVSGSKTQDTIDAKDDSSWNSDVAYNINTLPNCNFKDKVIKVNVSDNNNILLSFLNK